MKKVINMEEFMAKKVSRLINLDFRPSEISKIIGQPIEKIHDWMCKYGR